jgi:PadR family transcriptional regulator AphA
MVKLTPTGRVILGMLRLGARTGYDIKRTVEVSTRFFWGASYGQIYPELRRLAEAGLVAGESDPRGGIMRTAYRLTPAGEQALREWLQPSDELIFEYRDEALLKLFFGDALEHDDLLAHIRRVREWAEWVEAQFGGIAEGADEDIDAGRVYPYVALRFGIELMRWMAAWYADLEGRLERGEPPVTLDELQPSS